MDQKAMRCAGLLILTGGLLFWAGAFYPPYKQWMTSDTKEYLTIIYSYLRNWYIIHGLFLSGVIVSLLGIQFLFSIIKANANNVVFPVIGSTAFLMGSILWTLNIGFRLTATVRSAEYLVNEGKVAEWYEPVADWTNLLFAIFMVLSYVGLGCLGYSMWAMPGIPSWVSWFCKIFGFVGAILYLCSFPLFEPPLMVYLPLILTGLVIIIQRKSNRHTKS